MRFLIVKSVWNAQISFPIQKNIVDEYSRSVFMTNSFDGC